MKRAQCKCGNLRKVKWVNGTEYVMKYCNACYRNRAAWANGDTSYRQHKKGTCELCGFIPVHSHQLDVDHIDGNRDNNNVENLQTLCANCHRLKTWTNRDFVAHYLTEPDLQLDLFGAQ